MSHDLILREKEEPFSPTHLSAFRCSFINGVSLALANGDNQNDQFAITDFVNQAIAGISQLYFKSVIMA